MQRNPRVVLLLGILVIILMVAGYYLLLLGPKRQELQTAREERVAKEAQLQQLEQQVAELENIRRNAPEIERQLLELSKRIPSQDEIPTLVVQVEQLAETSGVTQLLIQPDSPAPAPDGGNYTVIPITMSFEGTYDEMQDFLLRVRNLVRLVTVNEVTYELVQDQQTDQGTQVGLGAENLLQVEVIAEVYAQPSGGPVPVTPPPTPPPAGESTTQQSTTPSTTPAAQ